MTANERWEKAAHDLGISEEIFPKHGLVDLRRVGDLIFVSGCGCGAFCNGRVGDTVEPEMGYRANQFSGLWILSVIKDYLGDLGRIEQVLRIYDHISVDNDYHDLDYLADGISDVFATVLGDRGTCPRTVLGATNLPGRNSQGSTCEPEVIFVVRD